MTKPHAEIREALVTGIKNNPEKSAALKAATEVLIACIDNMEKHGSDPDIGAQFDINYALFLRRAKGETLPPELSPAEIAKAFGLGGTHQ